MLFVSVRARHLTNRHSVSIRGCSLLVYCFILLFFLLLLNSSSNARRANRPVFSLDMEFPYDLSRIAHEQIVKIDNTLLPIGYQHDDPESVVPTYIRIFFSLPNVIRRYPVEIIGMVASVEI